MSQLNQIAPAVPVAAAAQGRGQYGLLSAGASVAAANAAIVDQNAMVPEHRDDQGPIYTRKRLKSSPNSFSQTRSIMRTMTSSE